MSSLSIAGTRKSGQIVRDENATAVLAMANIVRSSLGPAGLDKMIVDDVGEVTITNDGATMLKLIEVEHPAAKILVELAQLQDQEVGDGTTSVVILAAELVRRGNELIKSSIHPTTVISGFQQARKAACKFLAENLTFKVEELGAEGLRGVAKTTMASKSIGGAADHFASLAVAAIQCVGRPQKKGAPKGAPANTYAVKDVGIVKIRGDSLADSELLDGVAIERNRSLASFEMPTSLSAPKIAFVDFDLRKEKLPFNVKVVCTDPARLEAIRAEETGAVERRVALLVAAGAKAVLSARAVDDFALKAFARAGVVALKNVPRPELKRAAAATGGRVLTSLAAMDGKDCDERVPADALGAAESLRERRVGDAALLVEIVRRKSGAAPGAATLLLRGPNEAALDEAERAVHDVLCALKRVLESRRVVVGGGVVETALSVYLENFAETIGSREQLAVAEYASALLSIPKTLAANGAFDTIKMVAALRAAHSSVIRDGKTNLRSVGLELGAGKLRDNFKAGVFEPAMSKVKSLKFATEAAVAILRIDDSIVSSATGGGY